MSQSNPSWRAIKTSLAGMDANSLISLIHDLYALNKENKEYLQGRVGGEAAYASLRENAAKKIRHEFFPERGYGKARIAPVKKAIQGYKKATGDPIGTADLTLQFIEQFVKLCREYGGEEQSKLDALSVAMKELLKILESCPAIIEVLNIEERLAAAKKDASYFGFGIEDKIFDLIVDIEALE
ncbi:hypothetical protein Mhun_1878 [Methanospirillum hungatei JF-1]|uniref:Uncharacterized protein n=1 Tax=Methanospirillum hungatei JF-1 (strain ATCC 27890 / DSM 864 / NBRC 100397 / JF-1) TaxID=323259 RepID=Q2FM43_METHJ|nr:hypothetical protein [Methanospirillum hungatei]ABD41595.1 hypothetical protein Mhun_1878 [Methanospirillum hungatei JF-1]